MAIVCFVQAEDGIRVLVRSRGLGDVYKRQGANRPTQRGFLPAAGRGFSGAVAAGDGAVDGTGCCLLYTSDAADGRSSVALGGRRIIKKKNNKELCTRSRLIHKARGKTRTCGVD